VAARRPLVQLAVYEVVLVLPLLLLYGLRVVRPLSRLADAARRYPAAPLADPALLRRGDEIATLAHTLSAMASDLEARRQQAADLGADIAHEFKNPLASIAASAELLASTKTLTAERVELISATITASVERLRRSIDELLALLRLEQAVPDEAREPTPYAAFLAEVLADYRRDPRFAGWTFTLAISDEGAAARVEVQLNRRRFAELLRNLIDNALVQPAARREIIVSARRVGGELVTSVRDFGPGIAPENRERVFQRFFSARPAGAPQGSGLGLSVARAIAHAHGGRVELGPPGSDGGAGAELLVIVPAPVG
jgi:two-component system sensor histidine kinase ChvG